MWHVTLILLWIGGRLLGRLGYCSGVVFGGTWIIIRGNDYGVISLGLFFRLILLILVGDLFLGFRVQCFSFLCW